MPAKKKSAEAAKVAKGTTDEGEDIGLLRQQILANKAFKEKVHIMCKQYPAMQNCVATTTEIVFCRVLKQTRPNAAQKLCANALA